MVLGRYRPIKVDLNRNYRNDLNANFEQIEKDITGVNQEISRVEQDLDEKIESITGSGFLESLEAARDSANESATEANTQAGYAKNQGDYAKQQGDSAKQQSEYATLKGDYANEKAILADQAASKAESEASNLSQLKIDVVNATQGANTAATNAESATIHANTSGDYAKEQGDYAKAQGDYAKQVADDISEQAGVTSINGKRGAVTLTANDVSAIPSTEKGVPNGVAATNAEGKVVDAFGNEVEGKMKSINHTEPDETGNVTIDIQTPADNALEAAKEYTDQAILNANQGEIKTVYYEYLLTAETEGQTEFEIPLTTYMKDDILFLFQRSTGLNKFEDYSVSGRTITLNKGVEVGTTFYLLIVKDTLVGEEGAINGNLLKDGSLPLNKLAEQVVTSINGQKGDINLSIPTKTSELTNDSDYATNTTVSEVATNLQNHESKIATTTNLGHVRVDGETITINETGVISSAGGGYQLTNGAYAKPFDGDLNDLTETGFYSAAYNQNANFPTASGGLRWLVSVFDGFVEGSTQTNLIWQIAINPNTRIIYIRNKSTGGWFDWSTQTPDINTSTSTTSIYVDGSLGTDSPEKGGSSGAGAYKTIQYAINQIKKLNLGFINVNIAAGTYEESVNISFFLGGRISLNGTSGVIVKGITSTYCNYFRISNMNVREQLYISNVNRAEIASVQRTTTFSNYGIYISDSKVYISSTTSSNCGNSGIFALQGSVVTLMDVTGSNNNVGIESNASIIIKSSGNTITGTTPQVKNNGGQIF